MRFRSATIYSGSGYIRNREAGLSGAKGVSCQEDACEIGAGVYIPSHQILGVRQIRADGTIGPFEMNPNADKEVFQEVLQYIDVIIYLLVKNIHEARHLETLMVGDKNKVEGYDQRIINYHKLDNVLNRQIRMDAINKNNPEVVVSELLRGNYGNRFTDENYEFFSLFAQSIALNLSVNKGEAIDLKKAFNLRKALSEEELIERAKRAKQLHEQPEVNTTPLSFK